MPTSLTPPPKDDKVEGGNFGAQPKQVTVSLKLTVTLSRAGSRMPSKMLSGFLEKTCRKQEI